MGNTVASSCLLGLSSQDILTTTKHKYLVISVQLYVAILNFKNNGAFPFALAKAVELCFLCMSYYKISNKDLNPQEL